jgi:hypothetical protein
MTPPVDDYCELCDLPLSTCVHGQPKPPPAEPPAKAAPRKATPQTTTARTTARSSAAKAPATSVRSAPPRRTPQREFRPHILAALQESGGRAEVEDLMSEIARRMEPVLRPADHETVNQGEVRWRYAARLERKAMLDDGLMAPPRQPGVWELTDQGRQATE